MYVKVGRQNRQIFCTAFDVHTQHLLNCHENNVCLKLKQKKHNICQTSLGAPSREEAKPEGQIVEEQDLFELPKQWHPVYTVMHMNPEGATPIQVMGKNLVLWKDEEQQWRCSEDSCALQEPHQTEGEDCQSGKIGGVDAKEFSIRQKFGLIWICGSPPSKTFNSNEDQVLLDSFFDLFKFGARAGVWAACALLAAVAVFAFPTVIPMLQLPTNPMLQLVHSKAIFCTFIAIMFGFLSFVAKNVYWKAAY
eukprot:TRINITY_DN4977_c0_g1_i10.p1 TRINITY_DN4977_c0_g1~~TRINITY_DN4977_c0_g1_i10.p1  ORF type:complete len:250 (-),score=36.62 TRINITY_DN4977_c0_g1_i10:336-1085(-)